jgi:hypothetical protein
MVVTYMLTYYDKAILGQAALFGFMQSLDLQTLVSKGPPPVYSTIRFSQGFPLVEVPSDCKSQLSFIVDTYLVFILSLF